MKRNLSNCLPSCLKASNRSWRSTIRRPNNSQSWRAKPSQSCSSFITPSAFHRGSPRRGFFLLRLLRMRSTLRQTCFRKRSVHGTQESSQSETTWTFTSRLNNQDTLQFAELFWSSSATRKLSKAAGQLVKNHHFTQ